MGRPLFTLLSKFQELFPNMFEKIDEYRAPKGDSMLIKLNDGTAVLFTYNGKDWKLENERWV